MGIAQIASFRPPPLCQTGKHGKKVPQIILTRLCAPSPPPLQTMPVWNQHISKRGFPNWGSLAKRYVYAYNKRNDIASVRWKQQSKGKLGRRTRTLPQWSPKRNFLILILRTPRTKIIQCKPSTTANSYKSEHRQQIMLAFLCHPCLRLCLLW